MTAGTLAPAVPVGPAPKIPSPYAYGLITNDTTGLGTVRDLAGGEGSARWKQLINGMHLPGPWGCVEYVELPPGSSCGRHLHAEREEIYLILTGTADMSVNGDEVTVREGDLVTAPLGTVHGIGVAGDAAGPMSMLVVEAVPGGSCPPGPAVRIPLYERLDWGQGWRGHGELQDTGIGVADLRPLLTSLTRCTAVWVPPDDNLGPYRLPPGTAEVLYVAAGQAEITVGGETVTGHAGLTVGMPLGAPRVRVRNLSGTEPLTLISTEAEL